MLNDEKETIVDVSFFPSSLSFPYLLEVSKIYFFYFRIECFNHLIHFKLQLKTFKIKEKSKVS